MVTRIVWATAKAARIASPGGEPMILSVEVGTAAA
jgi:hypothetical protein